MVDLNDFALEKRCEYKGRIYSVRDNGSVCRHQKEITRLAPLDNKWTFGKKDKKTGYMMIGGVRIHQIVATAFHGASENSAMIVDHVDTNRCNNRPENLRWLTRLENALNNPYTRRKIVYLCGSLEAFINNPSILRQVASETNISWMRTVSKEEADKCRKHLDRWLQEDSKAKEFTGERKGTGEWIFKDNYASDFEKSRYSGLVSINNRNSYAHRITEIEVKIDRILEEGLVLKDSLTPGAKQLHWKIPSEFPLCPKTFSDSSLQEYLTNLIEGETFCQNPIYHSEVIKAELSLDKNHIAVVTTTSSEVTSFALTEIRYNNENFIHESIRTFFTEEGVEKYYTLSLGKEWTGGDVFEDFC